MQRTPLPRALALSTSRLNRWLSVSLVCLCSVLLPAQPVLANEASMGCEDVVQIQPKVAVVDGQKGTWLRPEDANRVFFVLTTCVPAYRSFYRQQTKIDVLTDRIVATSSAAIAISKSMTTDATNRGDLFKDAYVKEHELRMSENSWSIGREPVFWFALGAVIAGALAIGIVTASKESK